MHNHLTPKFSVITVTYNAEAVLEDTIQSVISQTYRHVEYIIVDGASKDKTLSIIDRYKDHIAKVTSEPDKGLYDAMNKGIRLATGDYLCISYVCAVFRPGNADMEKLQTRDACLPSGFLCQTHFSRTV